MKIFLRAKILANQRGASAALALIVVALMSAMATGIYSIVINDSRNAIGQLASTQAMYVAEAGIEYGLKRIAEGNAVVQYTEVAVGRGTFSLASSQVGNEITLTSTAQVGEGQKVVEVKVRYYPGIGDFAIYSTGDINDVTPLDEDGNPDPSLMVSNADSLPNIDYNGLMDMAISQSHVVFGSPFTPNDGYPNGSFYYSGSTPNVTHVTGTLKVLGGRTIYGIFVVEGDVLLEGNSRVEGVIYVPNEHSTIVSGGGNPGDSSITGGIVSAGDISGTGNHITVHYEPDYMDLFGQYEGGGTGSPLTMLSWKEL